MIQDVDQQLQIHKQTTDLEKQVTKELQEKDKKNVTGSLVSARILEEKARMDEFEKLRVETKKALDKNEVIILPSLKLKQYDQLPRIDIL